jgi:hypothetical protein
MCVGSLDRPKKLIIILTHFVAMHPSWITIYVKLKFYQMLPETVAHHVEILAISFFIELGRKNLWLKKVYKMEQ